MFLGVNTKGGMKGGTIGGMKTLIKIQYNTLKTNKKKLFKKT